jgi:PQQ-like domain
MWNQPFGEPFYHEPYVIDNQLLIRSAYGNLYCLALDTGALLWDQPTPNVGDLIGSLGDHLFVTSLGGSFAVLDKKTGKPTSTHSDIRPARFLVNNLTDRLYLLDESGNVQCLRSQDAALPTTRMQVDAPPAEAAAEPVKPKEDDSNPFGAEPDMSNPFGATDAPADDPAAAGEDPNPFGDPAGAGDAGDAAMDSPFGDDNPFGG